jgi:DNA-directed RNA polymerase specialized sigma24 family protein
MGRMGREEPGFDEFVRARLPHLLRFGRALTCNDGAAGALVEETLAPVLARWDESSALTAEDDVRRAMVGRYLRHKDVQRGPDDPETERDTQTWTTLAALTPKQRTLVALRCHEDLSEGQAADVMRCSGSTARALKVDRLDEERVRRALEEPVSLDQTSLLTDVRRSAARRARRRRTVMGVLAVLLMGSLAATAVVAATQRSPATAGPGLADPVYAFAVSGTKQIFAVTRDPKCVQCSILWAGDGSPRGWKKRHSFDQAPYASAIRMAPNGKDGWAWFGRDWLQATHDGGKSWVIPGVDLRNATVDVQLAGSTVWVLLSGYDGLFLWRSEVGTDDWTEVPAPFPAASRYALVPLGDQMYVMQYLDKGRAALSPATDPTTAYRIPCTRQPLPPRSSPGAIWVTCPDDGAGLTVKSSVDGVSWEEVGVSQNTVGGSYPITDTQTFVVTSHGGRLVSAHEQTDVPLGLRDSESISDGAFVTPSRAYLLTDRGRILRTDDGGRSWSEVS